MIYIASDHGGFKLKGYIQAFLASQRYEFEDLGAKVLDPQDDYVDFAKKLASKIAHPHPTLSLGERGVGGGHVGILLCRSGQGVCMAANRYKGIRAATCWSVKAAKAARNDDWANVLCLPADFISRAEAVKIVQAFLATPWGREPRRARRVKKLDRL